MTTNRFNTKSEAIKYIGNHRGILEKRKGRLDTAYTLAGSIIFVAFMANFAHDLKLVSPVVSQVEAKELREKITGVKITIEPSVDIYKHDARVKQLQSFLVKKNSPFADKAEYIVRQADIYDIGWTKLASISGMESGYGINIPNGSYNAWGLGGSNFIYFKSWEESIHFASSLLGNNYKLNEYSAIKAKYCPASDGCNPEWSKTVTGISHNILDLANAN